MHHKKSEVQIGKESIGVSSDFNPSPPFPVSPLIHQKHHPFHQLPFSLPPPSQSETRHDSISQTTLISAPHKRPLVTHNPSLAKSQTFSSLHQYSTSPPSSSKRAQAHLFLLSKTVVFRVLGSVRRFRVHLRLVLLLSLPFFYFLVSNPSRSFLLDILSAFAFSATLLLSLHLALPRLPSIRLYLARSFPIKLLGPSKSSRSKTALPVFWSIGSRPKQEKTANSGCWVRVYSNGDVYEGEFHKGQCSGSGVYYYYMSGRYEGDWVDGKYDGYGVETWARGSRYRGQYLRGLRHGFGVYRFHTGDVYAGEWCNGQSHGSGVHTCEDGSRYVGEFKWGVKHGLGHYHFRNGDVYAGEYFADKMQGFGVYRFGNGHRYEGGWHEGKKQGLGMYSFRSGDSQCGLWQNGVLDVPSTQTTATSTSSVAVSHSRVLNAVQEARGAAEKAYNVRKVDERVNRTVNSANRAANAGRVAAVKAIQQRRHDHLSIPIVVT